MAEKLIATNIWSATVRGDSLPRSSADKARLQPVSQSDDAFILFHGLGLEHIEMEVRQSHEDWAVENGMVVSAHLQVPGDECHRGWLEEIFLVTPDGGEAFFTWDHLPVTGSGR